MIFKIKNITEVFSSKNPYIKKTIVEVEQVNNGLLQSEIYERIIDNSKNSNFQEVKESDIYYFKSIDGFVHKTSAENAAHIFAQADFIGGTE